MKMPLRLLTTLCLILCAALLHAQDAKGFKIKATDLQDYQYKKEWTGGLRVQSNGVTIYTEYGWIKDIFKTRLLQLEYTYVIDYRLKRQRSQAENGRGYFFGLQNRFHSIHLSYGVKRTIADKANRNGVRLSFIAFGGFSLGLLKPYYVNILKSRDGVVEVTEPVRYNGSNDSVFLNKDKIWEAAPTRYGLNQIEPVPGVHGKFGLNFDFGRKDEFVKALEAGIMLDLYYKRLNIMANDHNRFYQIAFYLSFHLGKRW
jgi:hypothetical protein